MTRKAAWMVMLDLRCSRTTLRRELSFSSNINRSLKTLHSKDSIINKTFSIKQTRMNIKIPLNLKFSTISPLTPKKMSSSNTQIDLHSARQPTSHSSNRVFRWLRICSHKMRTRATRWSWLTFPNKYFPISRYLMVSVVETGDRTQTQSQSTLTPISPHPLHSLHS